MVDFYLLQIGNKTCCVIYVLLLSLHQIEIPHLPSFNWIPLPNRPSLSLHIETKYLTGSYPPNEDDEHFDHDTASVGLDYYPNDEVVHDEDGDVEEGQDDGEMEMESGVFGIDDPYSKPWSIPNHDPEIAPVSVNGATVTGDGSEPLSTFRPWGAKNLEASAAHGYAADKTDAVWNRNQSEDSSSDTFNILHKQPY